MKFWADVCKLLFKISKMVSIKSVYTTKWTILVQKTSNVCLTKLFNYTQSGHVDIYQFYIYVCMWKLSCPLKCFVVIVIIYQQLHYSNGLVSITKQFVLYIHRLVRLDECVWTCNGLTAGHSMRSTTSLGTFLLC